MIPPPPHAWQVLILEDMVQEGRAGLTEAIVTSPGGAIFFYGQQSLGEGLSLGEVRDAMFILSGVTAWVCKQAQLKAKPMSLGDGQWLIAQAIVERQIEPRGLVAIVPFHLHRCHSIFIIKTCPHDQATSQLPLNGGRFPSLAIGQESRNEAGHHSEAGTEARDNKSYGWLHCGHLCFSSDHGFESNRSTAPTSSSVLSMSERLAGSRHPCHDQHPHREPGGHMKINLLVFRDEDTKDAITYQSLCFNLTVYHHTGCQDRTLLPYAIHSLQGNPGELVRSFGNGTSLWMTSSPYWMSTITMSKPWML